MSGAAFVGTLLRALPLCLVLPLPGLGTRIVLAGIFALAALGVPGADHVGVVAIGPELLRGLLLGLAAAGPLYAARWAGGLLEINLGRAATRGSASVERAAGVLAWVIFCAAGGASLLMGAYLHSYARWTTTSTLDAAATQAVLLQAGTDLLALTARLSVPSLLALALVELCGGLLSRFERTAVFDAGAATMAQVVRPILVAVLLTGSVAAFTHGVSAAVLAAAR